MRAGCELRIGESMKLTFTRCAMLLQGGGCVSFGFDPNRDLPLYFHANQIWLGQFEGAD
jgi:hypothetical protein